VRSQLPIDEQADLGTVIWTDQSMSAADFAAGRLNPYFCDFSDPIGRGTLPIPS
jgi:hypothetical protein